jgi:hypothetical protein
LLVQIELLVQVVHINQLSEKYLQLDQKKMYLLL